MINLTIISETIKKKFVKDVFFTGTATVIVALSNFVINTLIGKYLGASALGIYNSVLAIYIILSVIAVAGIPNSIIKHCSEHNISFLRLRAIFSSGVILAAFTSILLATLVLLFVQFNILHIHDIKLSHLVILLYALPFFTVNKTYRGYFNSQRMMTLYGIVEIVRWLSILLFTIVAIFFYKSLKAIMVGFFITELLLCILSTLYFLKIYLLTLKNVKEYFKKHLDFGLKTLFSDSFVIINNKIDILFLAYFTSNYFVGIYSLASEIAKGLLLFTSIIQNNFNPIISRLSSQNKIVELGQYGKKIRKAIAVTMWPAILLAAVLFPLYIKGIIQDPRFLPSIGVFNVLLIGIFFASVFSWAGAMITMTGFPQDSMKRNMILLFSTIILNLLLIPKWGIMGAAVATTLTYFVRIFTLKYFLQKRINFNVYTCQYNGNKNLQD